MRPLAALLLASSVLPAADLRLDHVTVAGQNLANMQSQLASTGLKVEPGGPHDNHATEMATASFPDGSYLELISIQAQPGSAALQQHPWSRFMALNAGPCAWAVRPKDFASEVARIRASGIPVKLSPGGRTRPDGVRLAWETANIGGQTAAGVFPFLIHDTTPRDQRAFPGGKPANRDQTGVLRVIIAVSKIQDAVEKFRGVYPDIGNPLRQVDPKFGAELAWITDTPVVFAQPLTPSSWIAERIVRFGEGPCAFLLGARKPSKQPSYLSSRWFGRDLQWFDPARLGGWWLGIEME